jgi:hypothetical protein
MKSRQHHAAHKPRLYLSRRAKNSIYAALGLTWGSGVLWIILHYFFWRQGDFGDEPPALEHPMLVLHGACAFAMLWLAGWLWNAHVQPWWSSQRRRGSGIVLIALGAVLIVSGWLLYYAGGDEVRRWTSVVHWAIGLALAVPVLVHALRAGRYRSPTGTAEIHRKT